MKYLRNAIAFSRVIAYPLQTLSFFIIHLHLSIALPQDISNVPTTPTPNRAIIGQMCATRFRGKIHRTSTEYVIRCIASHFTRMTPRLLRFCWSRAQSASYVYQPVVPALPKCKCLPMYQTFVWPRSVQYDCVVCLFALTSFRR